GVYDESLGGKQAFLLDQCTSCLVPSHLLEADFVARAKLAEAVEVSGDHVGDLRISAGGLLLNEENNRQAGGSDLNDAERHAFTDHLARDGFGDRSAFEAQAHAVGFFGDTEVLRVEGGTCGDGKPVGLRSGSDAQNLARSQGLKSIRSHGLLTKRGG